jgi:hypothetical protein
MDSRSRRTLTRLVAAAVIGGAPGAGFAQSSDLAPYFGFEPLEVIKIGQRAGPITATDVDGDGYVDLVAVNNHESRVEVHYQRPDATPEDTPRRKTRVNEFPEHWRFRREIISVTHRISAIVPHDYDGDDLTDLIYAGVPQEIVFLRQTTPGVFEVARRHRIKNLAAGRDGLAVADVLGDAEPELIALVEGDIRVWPLDGDQLGPPTDLATGGNIVAFVIDDLSGDGRLDVLGIIPDDPAPLRAWFSDEEDGTGMLGAQLRFEMPPLVECTSVRLPDVTAARIAVIERASKRIVVYEVASDRVARSGDREAAIRVHSFTDAGNRTRDHAVVDLDGDGRLDLVATDTEANALVTYTQRPGRGFQAGVSHPSLSDLVRVVAADVDDDPEAELFVLSEKEGVVGRCDVEPGARSVPFPRPIPVSPGHTPTALNLVELEDGIHIAVVAKDGRDYVVDLIDLEGETRTIKLGKLSRSPQTIMALDADQDGRTDLLLFTREKPMTMLAATDDGFELMESKDMGQFGLVQGAKAENVATYDIDGNGTEELLIAEKNYVRAVRYDASPETGVSPGWQVVAQINARDSTSKLVSLAVLEDRIIAADKENDRLVVMARDDESSSAGRWRELESLAVRGFTFSSIHAGAFSGDDGDNILAIGEAGFGVLKLDGDRITLDEVASWRTTEERRVQHELTDGDVNGDGFTDLVSLDAGEQMCEIFTFTASGRMLYATGFQVFESLIFSGGEAREYEPSMSLIVDVTGDDADDLVLLAHDRILLYPQMTDGRD